jgi:hypothetical protein
MISLAYTQLMGPKEKLKIQLTKKMKNTPAILRLFCFEVIPPAVVTSLI